MSRTFVLAVLALLGLALTACGGASKNGASSHASAAISSLPGDQDGDSPDVGYYDGDDGGIRYYGHAASRSDTQAITELVKRYYTAAASKDGVKACALTYFIDVETLPELYGQPPGPLWLRGASTCPAVLTRVFTHFHNQLAVPVEIVAVRVSNGHADVLVGFRTLPAGVVKARREGGAWKVDGLLAAALP